MANLVRSSAFAVVLLLSACAVDDDDDSPSPPTAAVGGWDGSNTSSGYAQPYNNYWAPPRYTLTPSPAPAPAPAYVAPSPAPPAAYSSPPIVSQAEAAALRAPVPPQPLLQPLPEPQLRPADNSCGWWRVSNLWCTSP